MTARLISDEKDDFITLFCRASNYIDGVKGDKEKYIYNILSQLFNDNEIKELSTFLNDEIGDAEYSLFCKMYGKENVV